MVAEFQENKNTHAGLVDAKYYINKHLIGGIMTHEDALEFILAGASAVAVGTANFVNPRATLDIIRDLETFLTQEGIGSVKELVGQVRVA